MCAKSRNVYNLYSKMHLQCILPTEISQQLSIFVAFDCQRELPVDDRFQAGKPKNPWHNVTL